MIDKCKITRKLGIRKKALKVKYFDKNNFARQKLHKKQLPIIIGKGKTTL